MRDVGFRTRVKVRSSRATLRERKRIGLWSSLFYSFLNVLLQLVVVKHPSWSARSPRERVEWGGCSRRLQLLRLRRRPREGGEAVAKEVVMERGTNSPDQYSYLRWPDQAGHCVPKLTFSLITTLPDFLPLAPYNPPTSSTSVSYPTLALIYPPFSQFTYHRKILLIISPLVS